MKHHTVCIVGGTGFVGNYLANQLVKEGHRVRVLTRHRERHRDLLVLPTLELVEIDMPEIIDRHNVGALVDALSESFQGGDTVINLVGILNERAHDGSGFRAVHQELLKAIVEACLNSGIQRLLHMSALHADAQNGASHYLRTKGEGENLVHAAALQGLAVTSFRPSVIFGPGDSFLNRFAGLLRLPFFVLLLPCPNAKFQPVYVGDVVEAVVKSIDDKSTYGQRYDLCGPQIYTLKQLVEYTARLLGLRRYILGLGQGASWTMAHLSEYTFKVFSVDNYRSTLTDSVCRGKFPEIFGIIPKTLDAIVPTYLGKQNAESRFSACRQMARHD